MSAQYNSKHGIVSRHPAEMFMAFADMRSFVQMLPEDKKQGVTADYDTITATVQGFTLGVKVTRREPYQYIELQDNGAPFHFMVSLHFDEAAESGKTDFHINLRSVNVSSDDGIFKGTMEIYVYDRSELEQLLKAIRQIEDVKEVKRVIKE